LKTRLHATWPPPPSHENNRLIRGRVRSGEDAASRAYQRPSYLIRNASFLSFLAFISSLIQRGVPMRRASIPTFALTLLLPALALAQFSRLTDQEVAARVVDESRKAYYATGHPCACPDDLARNGSRCGGRSAYSRPGGASPKCYASDVTPGEIAAWRARH